MRRDGPRTGDDEMTATKPRFTKNVFGWKCDLDGATYYCRKVMFDPFGDRVEGGECWQVEGKRDGIRYAALASTREDGIEALQFGGGFRLPS